MLRARRAVLQARRRRRARREYYLAAAVYAYAFLFPGPGDAQLDELDPRARIAADLYNRGLTEAFAVSDGEHGRAALRRLSAAVRPAARRAARRGRACAGRNRRLVDFVPVAELEVSGLGARYRRARHRRAAGGGHPAARRGQGARTTSRPRPRLPVTALLRIDDASASSPQPIDRVVAAGATTTTTRGRVDIDGAARAARGRAERGAGLLAQQVAGVGLGAAGLPARRPARPGRSKTPLAFVEPYRPRAHSGGLRARHRIEPGPLGEHAERAQQHAPRCATASSSGSSSTRPATRSRTPPCGCARALTEAVAPARPGGQRTRRCGRWS